MYGLVVLGVILGCLAEFFGGWANIQIKYSHKLEAVKSNPKPIYGRKRWWFAVFLYGGNTALNLASFMFAPLDVLAPTSALTIVINVVLAKIYFNETLTQRGYFGSILIIVGCVLAVIFGSHGDVDLDLETAESYATKPKFLIFAIFYWGLIITGIVLGRSIKAYVNSTDNSSNNSFQFLSSQKSRHSFRAFCYAFTCSGLATWVQLTGKDSGELIFDTFSGNNQFNYLGSWLILFYCVILIFLNLFFISEMLQTNHIG